jgi:hypothetical protein
VCCVSGGVVLCGVGDGGADAVPDGAVQPDGGGQVELNLSALSGWNSVCYGWSCNSLKMSSRVFLSTAGFDRFNSLFEGVLQRTFRG